MLPNMTEDWREDIADVIDMRGVSHRYGNVRSLHGVNLQVPGGSVFAVLGRNGAGKTTLMRLLLGLMQPSEGRIRVFGESMPKARDRVLARTGSMIETPALYANLTGYENLLLQARVLGLDAAAIATALEIVGLPADRRPVRHYSLGMKQRLSLAVAILGRPRLLLLDEPTNGLDPFGIREMRALLPRLPAELGVTVLLSTHYLNEVEQVATHVGILEQGRVVLTDSLPAIRRRRAPELLVRFADSTVSRHDVAHVVECTVRERNGAFVLPLARPADSEVFIRRLAARPWGLCHAAMQDSSLESFYFDALRHAGHA